MASPNSDPAGPLAYDAWAARILVLMGTVAVVLVVVGLVAVPALVPIGAAGMMLAPLAALSGVAVGAIRARDRLAGYAVGAVLVTALGMLLAR
ncbi:MAG: hypothetical protein A2W29_12905 [Gemmatimonadetes bacterium RBG_16_66_8]|nr:MAG: hypothetical protein A2W29_12905 [Gemmatimonadetes bacterium RBG_16_66_8]